MKKLWKVCVVLLVSFSALSSYALTGDEILEKIDAVMSAPKDSKARMKMILIDKNGNTKEREMISWWKRNPGKDDWRLIKFLSPPDVRGVGFLVLSDDRMYLYMPAFKRVRRIASHMRGESFMGSDLSYDDLSTASYREHYSAKVIGEDEKTYLLECRRKKGSTKPYSKMIMRVSKESWLPVEMEAYDDDGKLWKRFKMKAEKVGKYWATKILEVEDVKKSHKTVVETEEIEFDLNLPKKIFTERNLKRRVK